MTAHDDMAPLESTGLWRAKPEDQRREVALSFGHATLVVADTAGRPLTHWSLPAIKRLNPNATPALFSPDPDGTETLEIQDAQMIEALEQIHLGLERNRARSGRLRFGIGLGLLGIAAFLAVTWLPAALTRQTLTVVPPGKRAEMGATILGHIQTISGPRCRAPRGVSAMDALHRRVLGPDAPGQVVVVPSGLSAPVALPGHVIVLPLSVIEATDDPRIVAGHILAAALSGAETDPMERTLAHAGLRPTFTLLTTGNLPQDILSNYAQHILAAPAKLAPADVLGPGFAEAELAISPWAHALDPSGTTIDDLLDVEWNTSGQTRPIITDEEWVSLLGICQQ